MEPKAKTGRRLVGWIVTQLAFVPGKMWSHRLKTLGQDPACEDYGLTVIAPSSSVRPASATNGVLDTQPFSPARIR